MSHPFTYRQPTPDQVVLMAALSEFMSDVYEEILAVIEPSAERTLAIRKLQESRMWANVAILGITIA